MYELFYGSGGHGGPYATIDDAERRAEALLRGSRTERSIEIREYCAEGWLPLLRLVKRTDGCGEWIGRVELL